MLMTWPLLHTCPNPPLLVPDTLAQLVNHGLHALSFPMFTHLLFPCNKTLSFLLCTTTNS